jgi:hypothetical protein
MVSLFGLLEVGYRATRVFYSGWIEYFGGQGLNWVLLNLDKVNQWFHYNLKLFLGVFVMWIDILLFILIYYLNSLWFRARHKMLMVHAHCMLDSKGYKHTLIIRNSYCFSATTIVP